MFTCVAGCDFALLFRDLSSSAELTDFFHWGETQHFAHGNAKSLNCSLHLSVLFLSQLIYFVLPICLYCFFLLSMCLRVKRQTFLISADVSMNFHLRQKKKQYDNWFTVFFCLSWPDWHEDNVSIVVECLLPTGSLLVVLHNLCQVKITAE